MRKPGRRSKRDATGKPCFLFPSCRSPYPYAPPAPHNPAKSQAPPCPTHALPPPVPTPNKHQTPNPRIPSPPCCARCGLCRPPQPPREPRHPRVPAPPHPHSRHEPAGELAASSSRRSSRGIRPRLTVAAGSRSSSSELPAPSVEISSCLIAKLLHTLPSVRSFFLLFPPALQDIGAFHGYTISTLSRRAK